MPDLSELHPAQRFVVNLSSMWGHVDRRKGVFVLMNLLNLPKPVAMYLSRMGGAGCKWAARVLLLLSAGAQEWLKLEEGTAFARGLTPQEVAAMDAADRAAGVGVALEAKKGVLAGLLTRIAPKLQEIVSYKGTFPIADTPQLAAELGVVPLFVGDTLARWEGLPRSIRWGCTAVELIVINVARLFCSGLAAEILATPQGALVDAAHGAAFGLTQGARAHTQILRK
jgi:hypothetical protein